MCQTQNLNYIAQINFAMRTNYSTCTVFSGQRLGMTTKNWRFGRGRDIKDLWLKNLKSLWKNIVTKTIQSSAKSGEKMKLVLWKFPFLLLNYIHCLRCQFWCSHFDIFDFCLSDALHLPSLNWCYLVLHQKFIHFWTC